MHAIQNIIVPTQQTLPTTRGSTENRTPSPEPRIHHAPTHASTALDAPTTANTSVLNDIAPEATASSRFRNAKIISFDDSPTWQLEDSLNGLTTTETNAKPGPQAPSIVPLPNRSSHQSIQTTHTNNASQLVKTSQEEFQTLNENFRSMNPNTIDTALTHYKNQWGPDEVQELMASLSTQIDSLNAETATLMSILLNHEFPAHHVYTLNGAGNTSEFYTQHEMSALHFAATTNNTRLLNLAVAKGADLQLVTKTATSTEDYSGYAYWFGRDESWTTVEHSHTPMDCALKADNFDIALRLLQASNEQGILTRNNEPLAQLVSKGPVHLIPEFVQAGQRVNAALISDYGERSFTEVSPEHAREG